ncbi:macrophage erythroblast attacher [Microdochium nivale]|nr:macrophage erythroblast attacher [Microdochium nivale]
MAHEALLRSKANNNARCGCRPFHTVAIFTRRDLVDKQESRHLPLPPRELQYCMVLYPSMIHSIRPGRHPGDNSGAPHPAAGWQVGAPVPRSVIATTPSPTPSSPTPRNTSKHSADALPSTMADHSAPKLDLENHLLLEQPLLRLPYELLRKNLRLAHYEVEKEGAHVKNALRDTATSCVNGRASQQDVLHSLDAMIARMHGVKRKLLAFSEEEARLHRHEEARVRHLAELHAIHGVEDVKYDVWSRTRLDRLLVDYLLRHSHNESARALAEEKNIELLADVETFEQMSRIRKSLLNRSVTEALAWCTAGDTKKELRKINSNLEFMLRYQQYIELVRTRSHTRPGDALNHARKYLMPHKDTYRKEVLQACGMLAVTPASVPRAYADLYSDDRWRVLADLFTTTHNSLLSLPPVPLLHVALSSGLSALKTPACHSTAHVAPATTAAATTAATPPGHAAAASLSLATSVCPICSTELNELARSVPYAFHSKSHVEHDLLLLPNNRAYGKARLDEHARKARLPDDQVKDPRTGEVFDVDGLKKVYIT